MEIFSLQIRVLQPVRAKRPPPPPPLTLVRKQPPPASSSSSSSTNSLDFSIKTLDQIKAEKRKKQQLQQQKADGDEAARRESEVAGGIEDEQTNRTTTTTVLVPQAGDRDDALKEERGGEEGEGDSGKELPKVVAPRKPRKRVIIKRSTLRKNADSALSSTAESTKSSDQETSDLVPSPKKKRTTEEISTSESQTLKPCFDATCMDRSAPLPDNHQEQRESKLTLHTADTRVTFNDDCANLCLKNTAQRKKTNQQPSQHQSQP